MQLSTTMTHLGGSDPINDCLLFSVASHTLTLFATGPDVWKHGSIIDLYCRSDPNLTWVVAGLGNAIPVQSSWAAAARSLKTGRCIRAPRSCAAHPATIHSLISSQL